MIQRPGHNFAAEDPTIFLEDANITTGEKIVRQRQFPQAFIPSAPALGTGQVGNLSLQDIQRLHQTTGEILARSGQQQQPQSTSAGPTTILNTRGTVSTPVRSVRKSWVPKPIYFIIKTSSTSNTILFVLFASTPPKGKWTCLGI